MVFLDRADIEAVLPHRHPMLLVDGVKAMGREPVSSRLKTVTGDEPCFASLTGSPDPCERRATWSLVIESLGQAAALLYLSRKQTPCGGELPLLGAVVGCRIDGEAFQENDGTPCSGGREVDHTVIFRGKCGWG